jgi:hypothetical protein
MTIEIGDVGFETSFEIVADTVLFTTSLVDRSERDAFGEICSLTEVFFDIAKIKDDILKNTHHLARIGYAYR